MLSAIAIPDDVYEKISKQFEDEYKDKRKTIASQIQAIDGELAKYKTRKEKIYIDHLDGIIDDNFYKKKYDEFTKSEIILRERRENIELVTENRLSNVLYLLKLANKAPELFKRANQLQKTKKC